MVNPVISVENTPVPSPTAIMESLIVGSPTLLQQIPRLVTTAPPFEVILPPHVADVPVISDAASVFMVGKLSVVKKYSFPYAAPDELTAYALTKYVFPSDSPVILLVNDPVPEPLVVC